MIKIVENIGEISELMEKLETESSIWYPLWVDNEKHPQNTHISFLLVQTPTERYILPHQHTDSLSLSKSVIEGILNTTGEKWVFQKKKLLQSFQNLREGLNDVDTTHFLKTGETIDYSQQLQQLVAPYLHKGYKEDIIQSIPILKLAEAVEPQFLKCTNQKSKTYNWYNDVFLPTLSDIEQYGIRVDREKFIDRWPQAIRQLSPNSKVFTEYNPFTVTGRPSNRHGGVNYAALNKTDGSRECFVSDGIFLQMDYNAYHPRLIAKLIGFDVPDGNMHQWLADQYGCSVDESKGITFQLLYGGIDDTFRQIPYFDKVADYIDELWIETQKKGYLQTPHREIPLEWIEQPNAQKVFNYLLQAVETEMNVEVMRKLLDYIKGSGIRFCLYTYDSFLFDVPTEIDKGIIRGLKEIIEGSGFPVKASWGLDYGKL
jgi:DNA polymerase I-like protein with 3'-5' exonuclease and polymerase domains